jgi:hypothetical protein
MVLMGTYSLVMTTTNLGKAITGGILSVYNVWATCTDFMADMFRERGESKSGNSVSLRETPMSLTGHLLKTGKNRTGPAGEARF